MALLNVYFLKKKTRKATYKKDCYIIHRAHVEVGVQVLSSTEFSHSNSDLQDARPAEVRFVTSGSNFLIVILLFRCVFAL